MWKREAEGSESERDLKMLRSWFGDKKGHEPWNAGGKCKERDSTPELPEGTWPC